MLSVDYFMMVEPIHKTIIAQMLLFLDLGPYLYFIGVSFNKPFYPLATFALHSYLMNVFLLYAFF